MDSGLKALELGVFLKPKFLNSCKRAAVLVFAWRQAGHEPCSK